MPVRDATPYAPGPGDGIPGHFTISAPAGTIYVPAGLEAVLEYNNLFMNIQQNIDQYRITSIDGLYDADIRDTREANTADDGESPYNSFYGGKTITITGVIQTYSIPKLRAMQYALRKAFSDISNEYPLIFRTGNFQNDHMIYCKKIGPISGIEEQTSNRANRDFQISLRASNPRFLSYYSNFIEVTPAPTNITTQIAVAINRGDYKAQPTFRIYGRATNVHISNDVSGESFSIIKNIPLNDYIDFTMTSPPTLKNSLGQSRWDILADGSQRVFLYSGNNNIFYSGDSPRVQIIWRDSW